MSVSILDIKQSWLRRTLLVPLIIFSFAVLMGEAVVIAAIQFSRSFVEEMKNSLDLLSRSAVEAWKTR